MGNKQALPSPIATDKFLAPGSENLQKEVCESLRKDGVAIFKLDDGLKAAMAEYNQIGAKFFSQPVEAKVGLSQTSQYFGHQKNIGYVQVQGVKEFLKLKWSDSEEGYPSYPPNYKANFVKVWNPLNKLAKAVFTAVARSQVDGASYIDDELFKLVIEKVDDRSSISLINYFPRKSDDGKATHEPSKTHTDSGLLTFILCSNVQGLEVEDRSTKQFLKVEEMVEPREHLFCIVGNKLQLFAKKTPAAFTSTTHRVVLPYGIERQSLLFFFDVPA